MPGRTAGLLATHPNQSAWEQAFGGNRMDWCVFEDDFYAFDSTATVGGYTVVADAGGAQSVIDGVNGILSIVNDGDDNDSTEVSSVAESWKFAANKPLYFLTRVYCVEAATNELGLAIGLSDTVATNSITDDEGGLMASFDGALFHKVAKGSVWQFETSNAGDQVTNATVGNSLTTATWYWLAFEFYPNDGVTGHIIPYTKAGTAAWVRGTKHNITLSGLAEMHILFAVKNGSANAETLLVDYVGVAAKRT